MEKAMEPTRLVSRRSKVACLLLVMCFACTAIAHACSCIGKNTIAQEVKNSDVIVSGKILSGRIFAIQDSSLPAGLVVKKAEYVVLISTVYKGLTVRDTVKIVTGVGGGDCGFEFIVGTEYLIYGTREEKYFDNGEAVPPFISTNICTRTKPVNRKEIRKIKRLLRA